MRIFAIALLFGLHSNAEGKTFSKTNQLLDQLNKMGTNKQYCEKAPPEEETSSIYTDYLWKINETKGLTSQSDWTWMNIVSKFDPLRSDQDPAFADMEINSFKMNGGQKKQMLEINMGKTCHLSMRGQYQLNESQDQIVLGKVSQIQVLHLNPNCGCGSSKNCVKINYLCHEIIAENNSSVPLEKGSITTHFLKPLRDKRSEIDRLCH